MVFVSYTVSRVNYRREVICSEHDQALIVNIKADKEGMVSFGAGLDSLLVLEKHSEKMLCSCREYVPTIWN